MNKQPIETYLSNLLLRLKQEDAESQTIENHEHDLPHRRTSNHQR